MFRNSPMPALKFLVLFSLLFVSKAGYGSHMIGAEIYYQYQGGSSYYVTINYYKDCAGIPASASDLYVTDGTQTKTYTTSAASTSIDITPTWSMCTSCYNPSCSWGYGIKQYQYHATVNVSAFSGCNLTFYWNQCCSSVSVGGGEILVQCTLNRCHTDQSSPVFIYTPKVLVCANELVDAYQDATKASNSDSIAYHLAPPEVGTSVNPNAVYYYPGKYTYQQPLAYSGSINDPKPNGFHYDTITGHYYFTPKKIESSMICFVAEEYAKDSKGKYYLAGSTMRDYEISSISCGTNSQPQILFNKSHTGDTFYTCVNQPITINVQSSDPDKGDTLSLGTDNYINGSVAYTKVLKPSLKYTFYPSNSDVGVGARWATFTVADRGNPLYGFVQRRLFFIVKDSIPNTDISLSDSGCGHYHLSTMQPVSKSRKMTWMYDSTYISSSRELSYFNPTAGKHTFTLKISSNSGCPSTYTKDIYYDTMYKKMLDTGICKGSSLKLLAFSGIKDISWYPTKGLSDSTIYAPVATPDSTIIYTASGNDGKGCPVKDNINITVSNFKIKTVGDLGVCIGTTKKLFAQYKAGSKHTWFPDSIFNNPHVDTLFVTPRTTTSYVLETNYKGCIKHDTVTIFVNNGNIKIDPIKTICGGDSFKITAPLYPGSTYQWYDPIHLNTLGTKAGYLWQTALNANSKKIYALKMTDSLGCVATGTTTVNFLLFKPSVSGSNHVCHGSSVIFTASGGNKYLWNGVSVDDPTKNTINLNPDTSTSFSVSVKDSINGCSTTIPVSVKVYSKPVLNIHNTTICNADSAKISISGGDSYQWSPGAGLSDSTVSNPTAFPVKNTLYRVKIFNTSTGCLDHDSVMVNVNDCVWPGDANKDKTVDYHDVLTIGLGFGKKGPSRATGSTKWQKYQAADWAYNLASGINFKHLDCNGDGVIDAKDTVTINANYGKKHTKWTPGTGNPNDPPVYFKLSKDTFYAGDTVTAFLYLGSSSKPIKNSYGIGYAATYFANQAVSNSVKFSPFCDFFCSGTELNYLRPDPINQKMEAVTVETSGNSVTNTTGKIGVLTFILKDTLRYLYKPGGEKIYAKLLGATVIDNSGKEIKVYGMDDSAIVVKPKMKKTNGNGGISENIFKNGIKTYPNPADNTITIETNLFAISRVDILNSLGKVLVSEKNQNKNITIDVSALKPGMYYLQIMADGAKNMEKIVIER